MEDSISNGRIIFSCLLSLIVISLFFALITEPVLAKKPGSLKWDVIKPGYISFGNSPAVGRKGILYCPSKHKGLIAVNNKGSVLWVFETNGKVNSTPTIGSNGTIYVLTSNCKLLALSPHGFLKWKFKSNAYDEPVRGQLSPAIGNKGTIYVNCSETKICALSPQGKLKWSYQSNGMLGPPAIGIDGTIYVGSGDGYLYALSRKGNLKWKIKIGLCSALPAINKHGEIFIPTKKGLTSVTKAGKLRWRFDTGKDFYSSPTISDDEKIYFASSNGYIYSISRNREFNWKFKTNGNTRYSSPAIGDDGTVYVGSGDGYLYALTSRGELKWKIDINYYPNSSPVIGPNGTVYIASSLSGKISLRAIKSASNGPKENSWSHFGGNPQHIGNLDQILIDRSSQSNDNKTGNSRPMKLVSGKIIQSSRGAQANISVKGPDTLKKADFRQYEITIKTKDFGSVEPQGKLPNILDGNIILSTDESAIVDRNGISLQYAQARLEWKDYYSPSLLTELAGKGTTDIASSLGTTAGILGIGLGWTDKVMDILTDKYVLGGPPGKMDPDLINKNKYDQWNLPWSFAEPLPLSQESANGIKATIPLSFEKTGTHKVKVYTGYHFAPENELMNEESGLFTNVIATTVGNNTAYKVGQVYEFDVEVVKGG